MIKSPFTIYFDIETYSDYLNKTNLKNKNHEKLLKPHLVGYILKGNYNEDFSKKCQISTGSKCIEKMMYNSLIVDNDYINDIIEKHFYKKIENNSDLSKFSKDI